MEASAVAVLADDLIWSVRLAGLVTAAGRRPLVLRSMAALGDALPDVSAVVVDLTSRAYDGVAAVELASNAGRRVVCVGQHDDAELRRRALAAGAERVYAYRLLFERGSATLSAWLGEAAARTLPAGAVE